MTKWLKRAALSLFGIVLIAVIAIWWLLRGSLPELDGELVLSGLSAPVTVQRDALGTVTIDAANEADAMRALGYVHAQERYFEMDLMRRSAAGELAELFGPVAVDIDKQHRVHRMRARVMRQLDAFAGDTLPQLTAYSAGVNAGLADLRARPWPYLLLGQPPVRWQIADSALTGYAMYFDLQDSRDERELALWKIKPHLPPALYELLTRDGTRWDAPLMGKTRGDAILPTEAQVDLRKLPAPAMAAIQALADKPFIGSNNFAISGTATKDGRAIVADDMHLGLRAPNIWFRARLRYADARAPGGKVDVQGFTLPGLPGVIVGSNGHVAWGFTNSYIDTSDWYAVHPCPANATPSTQPCDRIATHRETIRVAGAAPVTLDVEETRDGPILQHDGHGNALALRWVAQLPGSLNLHLLDLAHASGLDSALAIAAGTATPTQNLVIGDSQGRIAWRLLGPIPERTGSCSANTLVENANSRIDDDDAGIERCAPWQASTATSPALTPPPQRLWTANNRTLDGAALARVGDGGYALGARAKQIRDDLFAKQTLDERDLLATQLDDRAVLLTPWWKLLRQQAQRAQTPAILELAQAATQWQGRASPDSVGYRIVRAWRLAVHARLLDGLLAPANAALGDDFIAPNLPQFEGVAWPLVTQRPDNLLPRRFSTWDGLFEDAAVEVRDTLAKQGPLAQRTWGERNTAAICHPLASSIPLLGKRFLCMPPDQLPGDSNMPRVAAPHDGASERLVVSPGHEADGIIHMPGGQSGHPLSPFWGAGHEDWVHGRATPFLPGRTEYTLKLRPANNAPK